MPNLTRDIFIADDVVKVAISKDTMFIVDDDGESIVEVPMLKSIRATETIPQGYAVDYHLDPATVITSLAKKNITTTEQLPDGLLDELKAQINGPNNVTIAPAFVVEDKRAAMETALQEVAASAA